MNKTTTDRKGALESFIDATSLSHVLNTIAEICDEKADHLRTNWQAHAQAQTWESCANRLSMVAVKEYVTRVSLKE
jgi:hypothetical protein